MVKVVFQKPFKITSLDFLGAFFLFLIIGGAFAALDTFIEGRSLTEQAQGQIVEIERTPGLRARHRQWYYHVQFSNEHGTFMFRERISPRIALFQVGDTVEVIYDPGNARNARIKTISDRDPFISLTAILIGFMGLGYVLWKHKRFQ